MNTPRSIAFSDIADSLRVFFSQTEDFKDVNWEGSVASQLLRILAYDQRISSLFLGLVMNESRLSTATTRENAAAAAASLNGYVASSRTAARMVVDLKVYHTTPTPPDTTILLKEGTKFLSNVNGAPCVFSTVESVVIPYDSAQGLYSAQGVTLIQGERIIIREDVIGGVQEYLIEDRSIDISTINVTVKENDGSTRRYERFNPLSLNERSFFLKYTPEAAVAIEFDDLVSRKLEKGERVYIEYVSTKGSIGNGAIKTSLSGSISGLTKCIVHVVRQSSGGSEPETAETIKRFAPLSIGNPFSCVTSKDFIAATKSFLGDGYSISSWGGETNEPPKYGYQLVSIKPSTGLTAAQAIKDDLRDFLLTRCVGSITPIIQDASVLYIQPKIRVIYARQDTVLGDSELREKVRLYVQGYSKDNLEKFSAPFDVYHFNTSIASADRSIRQVFTEFSFFLENDMSAAASIQGEYRFGFKVKPGSIHITGFTPILLDAEDYEWALKDISGEMKLIRYTEYGEEVYNGYEFSSSINYEKGEIILGNLPIVGLENTRIYVDKDDINQSLTPRNSEILSLVEISVE